MNEHDEHEGQTPPEEGVQIENLPAEIDHAPASSHALAKAYEAAGTTRVTEEQEAILLAPIDPEKEVELHPFKGPYVPWVCYTKRLNRAFGPMGWAVVRVGKEEIDQENKIVAIRVALKIEGKLVRDAVGECKQGSDSMSIYACLEGAIQNGIKRCCKNLGMFSEIHEKWWCEEWLSTCAERSGKEWKRKPTTTLSHKAPTPQSPPPPAKKAASSIKNVTEGFVRKAEKTTESGTYLLTIETEEGEVQLKGNSSLAKYPDKSQLVDLLVEFTTKEVPQRGGSIITVLDTLEIKGEPA